MTFAALAAAKGRREAAVARRVEALLQRGTLFVDTELATSLLGFRTTAMPWRRQISNGSGPRSPATRRWGFTGAVSGPANLAVSVTCRDSPDLYRYLTRRLSAIEAIRQLEIAVAARLLKRAGTVMDGDRLPNPLGEPAVKG
jgi:DNA-binding Lrp family transcriptional regulator